MTPDHTTEERRVRIFEHDFGARRYQLGLAGLVLLGIAPLLISDIMMLKLAGALFFGVFVISWDIVSGYTGYISFGHTLFFGSAAYTSAMLNAHLEMNLLFSIPIAVVVAMLTGVVIGVPTLRLKGPYFSLLTLIAPLALLELFIYFRQYTGGERGLLGVENITLDPFVNYYLAFGTFLIVLAIAFVITRSETGSILKAIRGDEEVVSVAGFSPEKFKILVFVLSAGLGGLGGAVYVHSAVGSTSPSLVLELPVMAAVIIAAILGGMGTITGAAVGGLVFFMLRDFLRNVEWVLPVIGYPVGELYMIVLYTAALGVILYYPEGFYPRLVQLGENIHARMTGTKPQSSERDAKPPLQETLEKYRRSLRRIFNRGGND